MYFHSFMQHFMNSSTNQIVKKKERQREKERQRKRETEREVKCTSQNGWEEAREFRT